MVYDSHELMGFFAHAQTMDTRPLFPPPTWPGYEATFMHVVWYHVIIQPARTSDSVRPLSLHCGRFRSTAAASALLRPLSAQLRPFYIGIRLCSEYVPQRSALVGHISTCTFPGPSPNPNPYRYHLANKPQRTASTLFGLMYLIPGSTMGYKYLDVCARARARQTNYEYSIDDVIATWIAVNLHVTFMFRRADVS